MSNTNTIALEIARQIGNQAFMMIGAKQLVTDKNKLMFKVGKNAKGVNHVTIELNSFDTYKMTFRRIHGMTVTVKSEVDGVYNDMLRQVIEMHTGLYTKL